MKTNIATENIPPLFRWGLNASFLSLLFVLIQKVTKKSSSGECSAAGTAHAPFDSSLSFYCIIGSGTDKGGAVAACYA
jgi:hypothetical protein